MSQAQPKSQLELQLSRVARLVVQLKQADTAARQATLVRQIKHRLALAEEQWERLRAYADEDQDELDRVEQMNHDLQMYVGAIGGVYVLMLDRLRSLMRKALLRSQKNVAEGRAVAERATGVDYGKGPKTVASHHAHAASALAGGTQSRVQSSAADVTMAMQRLHGLLATELEKSTESNELLNTSSQTLASVADEYISFDRVVSLSRKAVKALARQDKWDRWMILGAFGVLMLTICWIIYRRVIRRGLRVLYTLVSVVTPTARSASEAGSSIVLASSIVAPTVIATVSSLLDDTTTTATATSSSASVQASL